MAAKRFGGLSSAAHQSNAKLQMYFYTAVAVTVGVIAGLSCTTLDVNSSRPFSRRNFIDDKDFQNNVSVSDSDLSNETESFLSHLITAETDLYMRRIWGDPNEDLPFRPKYLVTFAVGYAQRINVDACVRKFSENFTKIMFHYDGKVSEWKEFDWFNQVIHVSGRTQTKWWYAKRFLHPDVVASYDYIFVWDEDLGVDHFDPEEYLKIVKKHGLEISQPGLDFQAIITWRLTMRQHNVAFHRSTNQVKCPNPKMPPCAGFVEIMAPTFSRQAWQCFWFLIQNDLTHGWGLDLAMNKCVDDPYMQIGIVDSQWIVHHSIPSLTKQGDSQNGNKQGEVTKRCYNEWALFRKRLAAAENRTVHRTIERKW